MTFAMHSALQRSCNDDNNHDNLSKGIGLRIRVCLPLAVSQVAVAITNSGDHANVVRVACSVGVGSRKTVRNLLITFFS